MSATIRERLQQPEWSVVAQRLRRKVELSVARRFKAQEREHYRWRAEDYLQGALDAVGERYTVDEVNAVLDEIARELA